MTYQISNVISKSAQADVFKHCHYFGVCVNMMILQCLLDGPNKWKSVQGVFLARLYIIVPIFSFRVDLLCQSSKRVIGSACSHLITYAIRELHLLSFIKKRITPRCLHYSQIFTRRKWTLTLTTDFLYDHIVSRSTEQITCFCAIGYGKSFHNYRQKVYFLSRCFLPWPVLPLHCKRMLRFFLHFLLQFLKYQCSEIEFKKLSKNRN